MMKILKILSIITVFIILLLFYLISWSPRAKKSDANVENSKKIQIGMGKDKVLEIMGSPDARNGYGENNLDSSYFYQPPFAASSGITISFDSTSKVNAIENFE